MNIMEQTVQAHTEQPGHAIPRRYVLPILYLAVQMSLTDRIQPSPDKWAVEELAEALGFHEIRRQAWYRELNEQRACDQLDLVSVKKAALVVLTYVLKVDTTRSGKTRGYFSKIRGMLGADPIIVPTDLEEHKRLALRYLRS